jgi:hypothetical protein
MVTKADRELWNRIDRGVRKGIDNAILEHKRAGRAIAVGRNGKVVMIPPEKIKINRA